MKTSEEMGKVVRQLRGNMSLREFAKKCNVSHSTIDYIEKGVDFRTGKPSYPSALVLDKIATACNVSVDYIVGNDTTRNIEGLRPIHTKRFPMLGEIACGQPIYANEEHEAYIDASAEIEADFCLTARGDSMIGARINDGDIVFIKKQPLVRNGEIAAVIIGDEVTLKTWFYYPEKQKLVLNPANQNYEPLVYAGTELDTIICLGKAVCFMSNL